MNASEFCSMLEGYGLNFAAGVPCSILKDIIIHLSSQDRIPYVPATREDEAMGIAAVILVSDYTTATVAIGNIDELESEADKIEADLIEKIFSSDMDGFEKIMLRDFIKRIAQISDRAENVGDRIRIIVAKRSI